MDYDHLMSLEDAIELAYPSPVILRYFGKHPRKGGWKQITEAEYTGILAFPQVFVGWRVARVEYPQV